MPEVIVSAAMFSTEADVICRKLIQVTQPSGLAIQENL
jgi:hypothetical protein